MEIIASQSKTLWLLSYIKELSAQFAQVLDHDVDDLSQDGIKIFYHKKRFSDFLRGDDHKIVPITFEVWPSLSCDARCPLCTYSLNNARREADKTTNLLLANTINYFRLFEMFNEAGVNSVILTGGGEPTLHPELEKLARHISLLGIAWGMFTHGMHLNERLIHNLLLSNPRFIRLSINAGSQLGHRNEYRIGLHTYELVKENAIQAGKISKAYKRCIGLGYALNGQVSDNELNGIKDFVVEVMEKSEGGLRSVAFRPKVIYFDRKGQPIFRQPFMKGLVTLPSRIAERISIPLQRYFGDTLRVELKTGMFERLSSETQPTTSLATGWAGSIDHLGKGYILSELNGSPWEHASYGDYCATGNFFDVWYSVKRKKLQKDYETGSIFAPAHHKLSHIDKILKTIRGTIGIISDDEIVDFYRQFDSFGFSRPINWDFL